MLLAQTIKTLYYLSLISITIIPQKIITKYKLLILGSLLAYLVSESDQHVSNTIYSIITLYKGTQTVIIEFYVYIKSCQYSMLYTNKMF
jgi:chromosome condensin MukBEF MukE localization factor